MIRVYGFYSCGGYKDMYLGSSECSDRPTYYLPLLPIMKERRSLEDLPKIELQENLQQIRLVTRGNNMGFPDECGAMFSHGGYVAMYRMLSDRSTCLAMRDIPSQDVDEVGRNIPFNLLLIATDEEGIAQLDQMAVSVKEHYEEWRYFATSLFSYDPVVNGVKFDLPALFRRLEGLYEENDVRIDHVRNTLAFLMLVDIINVEIALHEQQLQRPAVRCIVDVNGQVLLGHFPVNNRVKSDELKIPDSSRQHKKTERLVPDKNATTDKDNTSEFKKETQTPEVLLEQLIPKLNAEIGQLAEEVKALHECKLDSSNSTTKPADAEQARNGFPKESFLDAFLYKKYIQYREDCILICLVIVILLLIF